MNAIQTKIQVDFYNDLTSSARFRFSEYAIAANDVINEFMDQMIGDEGNKLTEGFELNQQIRDSLFNLITQVSPTVTDGAMVINKYYSVLPSHIIYPTDYYAFISLYTVFAGNQTYCRPTTYNELGPLLQDSFKHPTNDKTYYVENLNGMNIWRGTTGNITANLTYIRSPVPFSIGAETDLITTGGTLSNAVIYYAVEISVYAGITYAAGSSITGTGATLTSGNVILASKTSPIDLPDKVHSDICKKISAKMLATIQMVDQSLVIEKEANKPD